MTERCWHYIDKATWPDGPWQHEPDRIFYPDLSTSLPVVILRNALTGALNGYVGIPALHSLYQKMGDEKEIALLKVYGGVNFSGYSAEYPLPLLTEEENNGIRVPFTILPNGVPDYTSELITGEESLQFHWWFGFHCSYGWDFMPRTKLISKKNQNQYVATYSEFYKDVAFLKKECSRLAYQLMISF